MLQSVIRQMWRDQGRTYYEFVFVPREYNRAPDRLGRIFELANLALKIFVFLPKCLPTKVKTDAVTNWVHLRGCFNFWWTNQWLKAKEEAKRKVSKNYTRLCAPLTTQSTL